VPQPRSNLHLAAILVEGDEIARRREVRDLEDNLATVSISDAR